MRVNLKVITPNVEQIIVEIARVSSSREDKSAQPEGLLNYLIKHKHWSPFEHGYITMEIETSKVIAIQLLRHRSFTFQEFSQRYQDVNKVSDGDMFEDIELRKQATDNRQSSIEEFIGRLSIKAGMYEGYDDQSLKSYQDEYVEGANNIVNAHLERCKYMYNKLLEAGVAREQARMVLPMTTKTRLYMTGSVRSWIHFLDLRDDPHAQKEIRDIAKQIKSILIRELPVISKALEWSEN